MEDKNCIFSPTTLTIFILGFIYILSISPANTATAVTDTRSSLSNYIVQVRKLTDQQSSTSEDLDTFYRSFLPATAASSNQEQRIVHSYRHVLSGFAAKLTAEEARAIREKDGVLGVRPERVLSLHTTHTPDFLGLHQGVGLWKSSNFGKGVIIGVLDSGIFPDHPSFSDKGLSPPPAKWKGRCDFNTTSCNNKLIGARSFVFSGTPVQDDSPYDGVGHGTHTSSTAAGAFVRDTSALGNANGTAIGMAPLAHLAVYKVCHDTGCFDGDILAGFDAAIEDGVDVLSLSLGGSSRPFFDDAIAIGAFAATQKGIFVSCSAGNSGPLYNTISNEAPWILTVGASSIDRTIKATARLGNGQEFDGETLYQPHDFHQVPLPLIYPGLHNTSAAECHLGSLRGRTDLRGKVVVCDLHNGSKRVAKGQEVKDAGGAAMILVNGPKVGYTTLADAHVLPAVHVSLDAGMDIKSYISTASAPKATIQFKGTHIGRSVAPAVAFFSSRGPSIQSPGILKPDIIGPGVNILAGWPSSLDNSTDKRHSFNVIAGTSMACPHLSGVAALLKSLHPDWSPAAIKSAIMTSATNSNTEAQPIADQTLHPADIFATGAGHINPLKAADPGLIYDIGSQDYIPYLCGLNYTDSQIERIAQKKKVTCSSIRSIPDYQLNYPSISVRLEGSVTKVSVTRTVKNVGPAKSRYRAVIDPVKGLESIGVYPSFLEFTRPNQTATFKVDFTKKVDTNATEPVPFAQGAITWVSAQHSVRTPIAVVFELF